MDFISKTYRHACREILLPPHEKTLFMRLLREISVNANRHQKIWTEKDDFLTLWLMSANRFPELAISPYKKITIDWIEVQLSITFSKEELESLEYQISNGRKPIR